jgi:hypothetical protein
MGGVVSSKKGGAVSSTRESIGNTNKLELQLQIANEKAELHQRESAEHAKYAEEQRQLLSECQQECIELSNTITDIKYELLLAQSELSAVLQVSTPCVTFADWCIERKDGRPS